MRVLITGTHSTGKTTLLDHLQKELSGFKFIGGVTREAHSYNLPINTKGTDDTQMYCMSKDILNILQTRGQDIIHDRSLLDTYIYSVYSLLHNGSVTSSAVEITERLLKEYIVEFDHIFMLRPEFGVVDDGVRDTDEQFQKDVDTLFVSFCEENDIRFTVLTGNPEERVEQFLETIEKLRDAEE